MQIKYVINSPDFMIGKYAVCIFSNTNFEFKVVKTWPFLKLVTLLQCYVQFEVHFKIFYR